MLLCSVDGCERRHLARGLCSLHYQRWRRHGDPTAGRAIAGEPLAWLEIVAESRWPTCIDWPYGKRDNGYGDIHINGISTTANAVICEMVNGPRPPGLEAAHSCGRRICVNPAHLRWDTRAGNATDRTGHGTDIRGERSHRARLTAEQVTEIRALAGSMTQTAIANQFGVQPSTISAVIRRENWRY